VFTGVALGESPVVVGFEVQRRGGVK